jgi:Kef-type K+ transport system membrane component KefB
VAILLTTRDPAVTLVLMALFVVVAVTATLLATQVHPPRFVGLLRRHLHSSSQLPVRFAVLIVVFLAYLALKLGLDVLLGAFAAGVTVRAFISGEDSEPIAAKLEAIGFGFLIPIFFVVSGIGFDLSALEHKPMALVRVPMFLALFLVTRGLPAITLYRRILPKRQRSALAFFSATGLPLIVVITTIGVDEGKMRPENAAALVAAGMLSVLVYPLIGFNRLRADTEDTSGRGAARPRGRRRNGARPGGRPRNEPLTPG